MKKILFILVAALMVGCKTCEPIVQTVEKERIVEVHTRDTAIVMEADSASVRALLKCDSAYNVILFDLVTLQGERIEASANAQKQGKDLLLSLDCKEDSLRNEIQLRDSIIKTMQNNTTVVREKYVPDYYKNTSRGFWFLLAIIIIVVGMKIAMKYLKIQTGGLL